MHVSIAKARGEPHWLLDPDEAKALSGAFKDFSGHYMPASSQKAVDTAIFVGTVAMIYGSRVLTSLNAAPPAPVEATPNGMIVGAPPGDADLASIQPAWQTPH